MGINRRQWLFNQIVAADPTKNTDDVFNGDLEETYHSMLNAGTLLPFSPKKEAVRVNALTLPTWIKKKALSQLNQSPTRILCVGDSTTAGVYSDSYTSAIGTTNQGGPNSYPSQLASRLTTLGVTADYSFTLPGHSGNTDSRWSLGSNWGYAAYGAGANGVVTSSVVGGTSTVVTPGIAADTYDVYYYGDSGTGVFTAQATGAGAATTINTAQATPGFYKTTVSASTVSSSNTITLVLSSGTVFIAGVESHSSTSANKIRVLNAGVGGSKTSDWIATSNSGPINFIKGIAPDLTVISLGINDANVSISPATVLTNINTVAGAAALSGDVILMSAIPHNTPGLVDQYNAQYYATSYPYIDLQKRWGNSALTNGLVTNDNTHPNALGYADIATVVANVLLTV